MDAPSGTASYLTPIVHRDAKSSTGGGTAHLRQRARERGHQIDGMTPMALDAGQPVDYEPALEMLIHSAKLHKARAGPGLQIGGN